MQLHRYNDRNNNNNNKNNNNNINNNGAKAIYTNSNTNTNTNTNTNANVNNSNNNNNNGRVIFDLKQESMERSKSVDNPIRRNTQESMAKMIAEKHKDNPISQYATTVRQAELVVLNMDPQTHSKTTIQAAEQNRERERQVYALLWLMKNCIAQPDSYVPRGRIFAQYAASCAQSSLKPLSQASLGKLIRSVFPDLTTRRLGMRGQSRYHYCGLKLLPNENQENMNSNSDSCQKEDVSSASLTQSESCPLPTIPGTENESNKSSNENKKDSSNSNDSNNTADASRTASPSLTKAGRTPTPCGHSSNDYEMFFIEDLYQKVFDNSSPIPSDYSLKFPPIPTDRLPSGVDEDIAYALESLYHIHCNTIFEHIRYMKFDQLPNCLLLFGSGSISPQMFNLFISEELYDWIFECDLITHVASIKYLSRMIMNYKDVSRATLSKLDTFARSYDEEVSKAIMDLPVPMVNKKKEIVSDFSRLVRKLVKLLKYCNEIATILPNFKSMRQD